jgi:LL-diaminopimelate aminotransferase
MEVSQSDKLQSIPGYAFDEMNRKVESLEAEGVDVIDLGVGDPVRATPRVARDACCEGVSTYATSGYPPYAGTPELRTGAAEYMKRMFDVSMDPDAQVLVTAGSKEAVFHFPLGVVDPGDTILVPSPGYVPYMRGALFAGARTVCYGLDERDGYLPDPEAIARLIDDTNAAGSRVRLLWLCYPNAPTGGVASRDFYDRMLGVTRPRDVVLASDEAYADFVWRGDTVSALQSGEEGVLAFFSLSKRSNMTGYRVGWVSGDPRLVAALSKVKVNLDSGTPCFVQSAAAAALADERHVEDMRAEYRRNIDTLCSALQEAGLDVVRPAGSIYVWQRGPGTMSSSQLCERLLAPEVAVAALPGEALSPALPDGSCPGRGYVRFSMTALPERIDEAARRIREHLEL